MAAEPSGLRAGPTRGPCRHRDAMTGRNRPQEPRIRVYILNPIIRGNKYLAEPEDWGGARALICRNGLRPCR